MKVQPRERIVGPGGTRGYFRQISVEGRQEGMAVVCNMFFSVFS